MSDRRIAPKQYYAIGEVAELVDLEPHVLRYWESQFARLSPSKNRAGNRAYERKDIKLVLLIKRLLYAEKYTIEGAKQRLKRLKSGGELKGATTRALDDEMIDLLRGELIKLRRLLDMGPAPE